MTRRASVTAGCCCCPPWRCSRCSRTGRRSRRSSTASTRRRRAARPARFVGARQLPRRSSTTRSSGRRSSNNVWYALGTIPVSIALALADGALGQRAHRRARAAAHGVLHADRAADDRGRQHLAVLLHAGLRPARADRRRCSASPAHNWLGEPRHRARRRDRRDDLEGSRLLHDLLSGGAAAISPILAEAAALEGASRWYFFRRVHVSAADADDAVRAGQRGDQRVPHWSTTSS